MVSQRIRSYRKQLIRMLYGIGKLWPVGPRDISEGLSVCSVLRGRGAVCTLGRFSRVGDDPVQVVHEYKLASDSVGSHSARGERRDSVLEEAPNMECGGLPPLSESPASSSRYKSGSKLPHSKFAAGRLTLNPDAHPSAGAGFYLSVKPPVLKFDLEYVSDITAAALGNGHGIHFDSHGCSTAEPTVQLLERLMDRRLPAEGLEGRWAYGLTLPSRWKRSLLDARWAAERGVRVRLVKGEFRAVGPSEEMNPASGFLALVDGLAGRVPEIALATHDARLARQAIDRCQGSGSALLLELLFGMPAGEMISLSRETGVPIGFYVPYGDTLLVYGIRYLLTNPRKLLRRDCLEMVAGHRAKLTRIVEALGEGAEGAPGPRRLLSQSSFNEEALP